MRTVACTTMAAAARGADCRASTSGRGAPAPQHHHRWRTPQCRCRWVQPHPEQQKQQQLNSLHQQQRQRGRRLQAATSPPFFEQGSSSLDGVAAGTPVAAAVGTVGQERIGVLLLNLGGPDSLDDVQPFLYNLFADPDIIRLPASAQFLQPAIAQLVSTLRAPKSREGYESIGGGSPLRRITEEQAAALRSSLRAKGISAHTYVAMRYWFPFTEEAISAVKRDGITQLVVLPLYPQFSVSTSGSSLRLLERLLKEDPVLTGVKHVVIPSWYQRPGYVRAMADLIVTELRSGAFPLDELKDVEIFFSAHGVPMSYIEEGDPYKEEMEECVELVMGELRRRGVLNSHTLAYQSRVGPVEWLKPYTDDSIRELAQGGVCSLLAVPISFVSEHIETLEEIDCEYRELAKESGIQYWGRVPALNTNATFIDDLADAVVEALPYVGSLQRSAAASLSSSLSSGNALVPLGEVDALLETYDRDRKALPAPVLMWRWGWTKSAETWNGRIAMLALVLILLLEATTGRGVLTLTRMLEVHHLMPPPM